VIKAIKWGIAVGVLVVVAIFVAGQRRGDERETENEGEYWVQDRDGWRAVGTPPKCQEPFRLIPFADANLATSVLYPGQMRSVGYEPTAGYRFDGVPNENITVKAPIDGVVVQAARFLVGGEMQYVFDILNPCGIMIRLDHLLTLSPKFQAIADKLPPPKDNDTRSTSVSPRVEVVAGEVVATATGLRRDNNAFISITMFDFRQKNKISQDEAWAREHPSLDHYVVCPYPYLPEADFARIKTLPAADYMSGSKSDFCEKF